MATKQQVTENPNGYLNYRKKWVGMGVDMTELWILAYLALEDRTVITAYAPGGCTEKSSVFCKETGEKFNNSTGQRLFPPYTYGGDWKASGLVKPPYKDKYGRTCYERKLNDHHRDILRQVKDVFDGIDRRIFSV